jgi:hypothetical protein
METEPLQPKLEEAQKRLEAALDEACAVDIQHLDTGELIRMEETLVNATKAAKDAVSMRLRMRSERKGEGDPAMFEKLPRPEVVIEPVTRRSFDDIQGIRWQAFAVHPSVALSDRAALPERFRTGWLSFESEREMRRVAPIPVNWELLSIDELRELCQRGESAPKRVDNLGQPRPQKP